MTTLSVTPDGNGFYLVRMRVVDVTLNADELRTLRDAIDAALRDAKACDALPSFCLPTCEWLNFTEAEQGGVSVNYPHICKRYDEQVFHAAYHPNLVRWERCNWKAQKPCDVCEVCVGAGCDGWTG